MSLLLGGVHLTHGFGHSTHWRRFWLLHWSESCTIWPSPTSVNENVAQQFVNLLSNQLLFTIISTPSHWAYSNDTTLILKLKQMNVLYIWISVVLILNTCFIWQFLMIHLICSQPCVNMSKLPTWWQVRHDFLFFCLQAFPSLQTYFIVHCFGCNSKGLLSQR